MAVTELENNLKAKLKEVFGYNQFRGNQESIIKNILGGKHTFVIMPTGAGKSMCYQLPALMQEGTAIVISPLIALMKNQVDQLNAVGINAQFLNSTLSKGEMTRVRKETLEGAIKLLYVAPESLTKESNLEFLQKAKISFIAVDEAHCISEWGHDFRPEYRRIRSIVDQLGSLPLIALTATATPKVRVDIQRNLSMEEADTYLSSFYRENLYYEVRPKTDAKKQLIRFISQHKGKSGIIYCLSRKKVEEVAEFLQVNGIKALAYHAGMDSPIRIKNQDAFLNEDVDVIVATIAFGMGIDKPDVRFVVHYDAPKSLEGYYQETGRAGRDGLTSYCLMLFSPSDILKLEKFNKDKTVTERDNARILLQEMTYYANSNVCRPKQLLHYFGEYMTDDCGNCDNCKRQRESFNGMEQVKMAIEAALQTDQRFGIEHLSFVITGNQEDQYVKSYGHASLEIFAKGAENPAEFWQSVIRQAMMYQLLVKDSENITVIKVTDKGKNFIENPYNVTLYKDHDYTDESWETEEDNTPTAKSFDENLFEILKKLRKKIAKQKGLPPYVIFQEPSLEEMATTYPTTLKDLGQVNGVGQGKANKFGKPFIEEITKYVEENDITTANDVLVKSTVSKSKLKIDIIRQIDLKRDFEEIADSKGMSLNELIDEIEHICYSGTKLSLEYYVDQIMDPERQEEVYDYFLNSESDKISLALEELGEEEYSEEEIRIMRIKFLSEYAL